MISLNFTNAVAIYVLFFVFLFLGTVIFLDRKRKDYSPNSKFWKCSICTFVYTVRFDEEMTSCPRCSSYNKLETQEHLLEVLEPVE